MFHLFTDISSPYSLSVCTNCNAVKSYKFPYRLRFLTKKKKKIKKCHNKLQQGLKSKEMLRLKNEVIKKTEGERSVLSETFLKRLAKRDTTEDEHGEDADTAGGSRSQREADGLGGDHDGGVARSRAERKEEEVQVIVICSSP